AMVCQTASVFPFYMGYGTPSSLRARRYPRGGYLPDPPRQVSPQARPAAQRDRDRRLGASPTAVRGPMLLFRGGLQPLSRLTDSEGRSRARPFHVLLQLKDRSRGRPPLRLEREGLSEEIPGNRGHRGALGAGRAAEVQSQPRGQRKFGGARRGVAGRPWRPLTAH